MSNETSLAGRLSDIVKEVLGNPKFLKEAESNPTAAVKLKDGKILYLTAGVDKT